MGNERLCDKDAHLAIFYGIGVTWIKYTVSCFIQKRNTLRKEKQHCSEKQSSRKAALFRFMSGIRHEVERLDRQLHLFSDTLDEWASCQKDWMYLKTIFSASDIQRQLPHEAKAFNAVDKQFKDVMRRTKERSNAMQAATAPGNECIKRSSLFRATYTSSQHTAAIASIGTDLGNITHHLSNMKNDVA